MKKQIQHESQFIDTKEKRKKSHISTAYKDNKKKYTMYTSRKC